MVAIDKIATGQRIRSIRLRLGLTMEEFIERVDGKPGKGRSGTVNNWETGKNAPNAKRLKKIASLGGVTVDYLLHGTKVNSDNFNEVMEKILKQNSDSLSLEKTSSPVLEKLEEYALESISQLRQDHSDFDERVTNEMVMYFKNNWNKIGLSGKHNILSFSKLVSKIDASDNSTLINNHLNDVLSVISNYVDEPTETNKAVVNTEMKYFLISVDNKGKKHN
ncbi:helix-turn-helix domain-containing protein [uncultured Limosilactobacillus sp.]|uniref:helix-turn-helix domain-containing protein n=1 Tax=uncultured Limosilactobacillus sp. TaxID=2837629 RepID=UPI002583F822|nr:helix-turn-helix transcriptional regulator [uncultured Limosilactobacillus sp.]